MKKHHIWRVMVCLQLRHFKFHPLDLSCEEIPAWRLFPERGGFNRQGPENSWLKERGKDLVRVCFQGGKNWFVERKRCWFGSTFLGARIWWMWTYLTFAWDALSFQTTWSWRLNTPSEWPNVAMGCPLDLSQVECRIVSYADRHCPKQSMSTSRFLATVLDTLRFVFHRISAVRCCDRTNYDHFGDGRPFCWNFWASGNRPAAG